MKAQEVIKVATSLLAALQVGVPVQAAMLQGGVQTDTVLPVKQPLMQASLSADAQRNARAQALLGTWQSSTQVVGSTLPSIAPGTVVESLVQYSRDARGNLVESWCEQGWSPSSATVVNLDSAVMTTSHQSSFSGRNDGWSARTHDAFRMVSPTTMVGESIVEQYINGQFAGQYKTTSVLHKII